MPTKSKSPIITAGKALPGPDLTRMRRSPTHPGKMFEIEVRKPSHISQAEAARRMGMSANRLNEIVGGKRGVTAETAILFGAITNTSPQMWLHLQADYDLWHAMREIRTAKVKQFGEGMAVEVRLIS